MKQHGVLPVLLRMEGITKQFGATVANRGVSFDVRPGEIHALVGENGAGKTTLMSILFGLYSCDAGEIYWEGKAVTIESPRTAIDLGIGMAHQHFTLVPTMTVLENIALGTAGARPEIVNRRSLEARIGDLSARYGLAVEPSARIEALSVGQQQRVEILKNLCRDAKLLILDEPTSVLTPQETGDLFEVLRGMKKQGHSVVFISHKLEEVLAVGDRITVLRDGAVVESVARESATIEKLAASIVGGESLAASIVERKVTIGREDTRVSAADVVLEVQELTLKAEDQRPVLNNLTFSLCRGEVFGVAGVAGNGQVALAEALYGLRRPVLGRITLLGEDLTSKTVRDIMNLSVAYVPENRREHGLVLDFSVAENLASKAFDRAPLGRRGLVNRRAIASRARELIDAFDIRPRDERVPLKFLSGGNQQKVVIARELVGDPELLIAAEPTQGLDVGSSRYVEEQLVKHKDRGAAVLLISTDLDQVLRLSDRVGVLSAGTLMGVVEAGRTTTEELGLLMGGRRVTEVLAPPTPAPA